MHGPWLCSAWKAACAVQAEQQKRRMWALNQKRTQEDGPTLPDAPPYRRWFENVSGISPPPKNASDLKDSLERIRLSANWMTAINSPGEAAAIYEAVEAIALGLCLDGPGTCD